MRTHRSVLLDGLKLQKLSWLSPVMVITLPMAVSSDHSSWHFLAFKGARSLILDSLAVLFKFSTMFANVIA